MNLKNTPQPLDALMTQQGLSNADLVKASTEQLTFKMVQKGRAGRRLTPNIQQKIHNALLAAKPGLKVRRRDLFHYEPDDQFISGVAAAQAKVRAGEVQYPEYVQLLAQAGVIGYTVDVAEHRITYFGVGGEAHSEQGSTVRSAGLGKFNADGVRSAIGDAQARKIDYLTFLKRIHEAGISNYEVNVRGLKISYNGEGEAYREKIPVPGAEPVKAPALKEAPEKQEPKKAAKKKVKKNKTRSLTRKARMSSNKRWRQRQKERRRR